MKTSANIWFFLCPIAIGCGYAGLNELQEEQLGVADMKGADTGGTSGDGDLGDGDMSLGGATTTMGGANTETGGVDSGTGGTWQPDEQVWSDPDRFGCTPFCPMAFNPMFSTHYLFEQDVVPAPGVEKNGQLFVATDRANWGVSSLGVKFDESEVQAYIPTEIVVDRTRSIFVRAWLYVPSGVVTGDLGLLDFLSGEVPAALVKTHPEARLSVETPLDQGRAMSATGTYPFDEWFCLRAGVYTDDQQGAITVEANNVIVADILGADTRGLVDINTVHFGVTSSGPFQGEGTIYWDSLIIDQRPVACDDMSVPL